MDIKTRKVVSSVWEYEISNLKKTKVHLRRREAAMRGTRRTRPIERHRPHELRTSASIDEFLVEAFG